MGEHYDGTHNAPPQELLATLDHLYPVPGSVECATSPAQEAPSTPPPVETPLPHPLSGKGDLWATLDAVSNATDYEADPSYQAGGYWFPKPGKTLLTMNETYALEEIIGAYTGIKALQRSSSISRAAFECVILDGFSDSFLTDKTQTAGSKGVLRELLNAGACQAFGNPLLASLWRYFNPEAYLSAPPLPLTLTLTWRACKRSLL